MTTASSYISVSWKEAGLLTELTHQPQSPGDCGRDTFQVLKRRGSNDWERLKKLWYLSIIQLGITLNAFK